MSGQAVPGDGNYRRVKLTLVVGPWKKGPGAQGGSFVPGVPEGEQSWPNEN